MTPQWQNCEVRDEHKEDIADGFALSIIRCLDPFRDANSTWRCHYRELVDACCHALGDDVAVEVVGSRARGTHFAGADVDLQVRRSPRSDQADILFTDTDKRKVAQKLKKLACVTGPVTIGNLSIKFTLQGKNPIPVDLVLANPRSEDFPKLRGGKDFHENSARIIKLFRGETWVGLAARAAVVGIKQFCSIYSIDRPKGILLDAIVWRLSTNFSLDRQVPVSMRLFLFFDHVVTTLQNWEGSPFGRDLKEDLDKLPARKRDEYIHGFKTFRRFPHKAMRYLCIIYNIACRSRAQSETLEELEDLPPFMQDLEIFLLSNFPWKMFDLDAPQ